MMKNIYLIILMLSITLASCNSDELLDKDPYDRVLTENLITDFTSFEAATAGAYNLLQDRFYHGGLYPIASDLMSDNSLSSWVLFPGTDVYETPTDDREALRIWTAISNLIAHSSIVIRQAESFDFESDQAQASDLIAQLYVIRGMAYFDMQRLFAQPYNFTADASHMGIPLIDETQVGIEIINPARSSTAEVYAKIISDIQKGITGAADDTSSIYYFNKTSAKALLARVYLYMENWAEANALATEVIGSGYSLVSNTDYVASWAQATTTESIFSIVNTATDMGGSYAITYLYGRPRFNATTDLFDAIDATDVRKNLIAAGKVLKYPSYSTRDDNTPILRVSEMYLIQAEAMAELGMDSDAQTAVNMILSRANPLAAAYTETGQALKDVIQDERRKELMFEGHRIFDLTRTKRSFVKYSTVAENPINVNYPSNLTILPIPQSEIDANDNISESDQNAGY
jgi:hypothetical protein